MAVRRQNTGIPLEMMISLTSFPSSLASLPHTQLVTLVEPWEHVAVRVLSRVSRVSGGECKHAIQVGFCSGLLSKVGDYRLNYRLTIDASKS